MTQEIQISKYGRKLAKNRTSKIWIGLRKQKKTLNGRYACGCIWHPLACKIVKNLCSCILIGFGTCTYPTRRTHWGFKIKKDVHTIFCNLDEVAYMWPSRIWEGLGLYNIYLNVVYVVCVDRLDMCGLERVLGSNNGSERVFSWDQILTSRLGTLYV